MVVVNNLAVLVFLLKFSLSNAYFQEIMAHNHIHIRSQRKWGKVCSSDLTIILGSFSPCPLNYFLVCFLELYTFCHSTTFLCHILFIPMALTTIAEYESLIYTCYLVVPP